MKRVLRTLHRSVTGDGKLHANVGAHRVMKELLPIWQNPTAT